MSLLVRIPTIDISAIKAKTDTLPASPADEVTVNAVGVVATAIKAKTDFLPADPASESGVLAKDATVAKEATVDAGFLAGAKDATVAKESGGNLAAVKAKTDLIGASVALESGGNLAAIKAKTDNLPVDPTSETGGLARKFPVLDFWSSNNAKITVTGSAVDVSFPDIVVTDLPSGLTIQRVLLLFMCRAIKDTSGSDNYINAAGKTIRIKKSAGSWGTDDVVGITFANQSLYTTASTKEGGLVIVGDTDLKTLVNANTTYNVQSNQTNRSDAIVAHGSSLELYDVQVGLRVFFS